MLTHIHLDHAGGVGALAIGVPARHGVGARARRSSPGRPIASGRERHARLRRGAHGDAVRTGGSRSSGTPRILGDGAILGMGGRSLLVLDTPGHASHHWPSWTIHGRRLHGRRAGYPCPLDLPVLRPARPRRSSTWSSRSRASNAIRQAAGSDVVVRAFRADRRRRSRRATSRCAGSTTGPRPFAARCDPTTDLDEIVEVLSLEAARETVTGAEAQLDLDRLETLADRSDERGGDRRGTDEACGEPSEGRSERPGPRPIRPTERAARPRRTRSRRAA